MTDRTALVTGAGRAAGLGIAVARALAAQGHHVIVTARDGGQAEEQAAVLRSEGLSAEGLRLDLADTDDFARVAAHVGDGHGRLDVLVNAVDPGRVDAHPELGVDEEDRPVAESAVWVVWAATLPADGPTGGVFHDGERLA
ncbi:SDR family NAD(P)-dependent oxidoreductase [Kitasatospora sp. MY 5-36]|uniref:SDR family NAD(P)-dependent oxidoreductase n=1 Tax=Kitasatospora sp. MY 5-36 TaxID=1678027 RepID=UPI000670DFD7|nr:SDR family NAD(P)-dependent oxidoreductase [Kitasatospora sp. MY 5-36]